MSSYLRGEAARLVWEDRLDRYESSGQSVKEFCALEGVSVASLYQWRKRLNASETDPGKLIPRPAFQAVQLVGNAVVTVEFPGVGTLKVPSTQLDAVRAVVGELAFAAQG